MLQQTQKRTFNLKVLLLVLGVVETGGLVIILVLALMYLRLRDLVQMVELTGLLLQLLQFKVPTTELLSTQHNLAELILQ